MLFPYQAVLIVVNILVYSLVLWHRRDMDKISHLCFVWQHY